MDSVEFKTAYYTKLASASPHLTQEEYVDIRRQYLEYHGARNSDEILAIPIEEMAELTQHLTKIIRGKESADGGNCGLVEEMADVQICMDSLKKYFCITDEQMQYAIDVKMEKLRLKLTAKTA